MFDNQQIFYIRKWVIFGFNCTAFTSSSFLLYLVIMKSNKMQNIRPILLTGAIIDFTFALLNMINNHIFIVCDKSMLLLVDPIISLPQSLSHIMVLSDGMFVALSWLTVPLQYNYRLYIIKHGHAPPWRLTLIQAGVVMVLSCIGCSLIHWVYFVDRDYSMLKDVMGLMELTYDVNNLFGNKFESTPMQIYFSFFSFMSTLALIDIFIVDRKIRASLKEKESIMGKKTRKLHAELSKVLLVMAISPVFSSFSQVIYISAALNRTGGSLLPDVISSILSFSGPLINSLTTMYFVRPYRMFFIRLGQGSWDCSSVETYGPRSTPHTLTNRPQHSSVIIQPLDVSSTLSPYP